MGGECSQIWLFLVLISYCGWWLSQITVRSRICFGHSSHFVAQIYTHHYVIIPIGYVLMCWIRGCILSNRTGMILSSLYWNFQNNKGLSLVVCESSFEWMIWDNHNNAFKHKRSPWKSERESSFWIVPFMVWCLYVWIASTRAVTCTSAVDKWFAMYHSVFIVVLVIYRYFLPL